MKKYNRMRMKLLVAAASLMMASPALAVETFDGAFTSSAFGVQQQGTFSLSLTDGVYALTALNYTTSAGVVFDLSNSGVVQAGDYVAIGGLLGGPAGYDSPGDDFVLSLTGVTTGNLIIHTGTAFVLRTTAGVLDFQTATGTITPSSTGAVPEPSTWAMMLLGFGGMGVALRRRKRIGSLAQMAQNLTLAA